LSTGTASLYIFITVIYREYNIIMWREIDKKLYAFWLVYCIGRDVIWDSRATNNQKETK
jgi:hypothetical protein